ncbi:MAG: hypothetical protein J6A52_03090 [Bacilli bacterium]|nr:hypothetical protein [Bacilli bacterium]
MKKLTTLVFLVGVLLATYTYRDEIIGFLVAKVIDNSEVSLEYKNSYYLNYNFEFVKNVDEFDIKDKDDLLDLYYTIINSGVSNFEFYCPKEYTNCMQDVIDVANNQDDLSNINGFVHPFNSFDTVETSYDSFGRVRLSIIKTYTDLEIVEINEKIKQIVDDKLKNKSDKREIIKIIHDYIINSTKYDKDRTDHNIITYASNTAYGVLFEGYGICSGYADAMALFLNYYNIPNYKVASENHVWNAVYLDGKWYHLDLTWDDPILSSGEEVLDDTYFLITTEKLKEINDSQHRFDDTIFRELA